jgi:hypothetical protein
MKITLNADKCPFYSVGKVFALNFESPGPVDIDYTQLTPQEQMQVTYGIKSGSLIADETPTQTKVTYSTPNEVPVKAIELTPHPDIEEYMAAEIAELNVLLVGTVSTVKKKIGNIRSVRHLKLLARLEEKGSRRPGVLKVIQELLDKHTKAVTDLTGTEDILQATMDNTHSKITEGTRGMVNLANLTDVVESDVERIVLNPINEE